MDSEIVAKLSLPLRMELSYEVHYPSLSKHPFFLYFAITNLPVVQRLCLETLQTVPLSAGDVVFGIGDAAWAMYMVSSGLLMYQKRGDRPHSLDNGMWVSEPVLWTPWEHRGDIRAVIEPTTSSPG